ncbi:unnamed protein product, partial [marine sediment metagenome]
RVLEFAKTLKNLKKFIYFSTDEVFGPAPKGIAYRETDRVNSTNPYSASKCGAEQLAMSYANCYKMPVIILNTMNVFGERQHVEKFIPGTIKKILSGETVTIHASPDKKIAGTRYYIHARNVSAAILFILNKIGDYHSKSIYYIDEKGYPQFRHRYNIVGEKEVDNLELAQLIAKVLKKPLKYEMMNFHSSRPGHDLHYRLSMKKMEGMGWELPLGFEDSLRSTIEWTLKNKKWLN